MVLLRSRFFDRKSWFLLRNIHSSMCRRKEDEITDELRDLLTSEQEYNRLTEHFLRITQSHRCLIIQPFVKWGPKKLQISPQEQLSEAISLIHTLPTWSVADTLTVPLDTLERKAIFKSGSMERIQDYVQKHSDISAIFINSSMLKKGTVEILQDNFQRPIFDRYKIVMQILKNHATSKHAKLQVALAELYYVQRKAERDLMFRTYSHESLKLMFQEREQKIKSEIETLRNQRNLLRNKRQKMDYPVVAVVGYTNSGKTSLIKALTGADLQPRDQLFATLDVTVHEGSLPSGLDVLYVDTVGFISDIPTNLIECFVATLEDAILANVILHVEDVSSSSCEYKRKHVLETLRRLEKETESGDVMNKMITVGNKCDLAEDKQLEQNKGNILVSAKNETGLHELQLKLEEFILSSTGRRNITIRIPSGSEEVRWLYKNATVIDEVPDQNDLQYVFVKVIISQAMLNKFKHHYIG